MNGRLRLTAASAALLAASTLAVAPARAEVTTDLTWSLNESTKTYGAPSLFHVSSGGSAVDYRWLDADMTKTTVITAATCSSYATLGSSTFGGGDTSYHGLFSGPSGLCFVVRGRTTSGTTTVHDGRLRR